MDPPIWRRRTHLETTSAALGVAQLQARRHDAPGQVARNVDAETSPMVNTGEGATTEDDDEW